jgi:hypothetical protein
MSAEGFSVDTAPRAELSASGAERRDAMLRELNAAMGRRNLARAAVRASVIVVPAVIVACVIWLAGHGPVVPGKLPVLPSVGMHAMTETRGYRFIEFVNTDPTITERLAVKPAMPAVQRISDAELQEMLGSMGRPTGIVRAGGRVLLVNDLRPAGGEGGGKSEGDGHSSI